MRARELRELADDFEHSSLDGTSKEMARKLLHQFASRHGLSCFDRDEQIAFIQHLRWVMGEPRSIIRDRLMAKHGIAESTAYDRINEALKLSGKATFFRTPQGFNGGVDVEFPFERDEG